MNEWIPILAPAVTAAAGAWTATWFAQRRSRAERRAELAESVLANAYRCRDALRRYLIIRELAPDEQNDLGEISAVAAEADRLHHRFRTIFGPGAAYPLLALQMSRDEIIVLSKNMKDYKEKIALNMDTVHKSIKLLENTCRREIPGAKR